MSRAAELGRLEADAVESEDPDVDPDVESEPEPEPEPEPTPEPDDAAPAVDPKALERVVAKYEKDLRRVLGPAVDDMQACPSCSGMGFVPGGFEPPPELVQDPELEPCPDCRALGIVLTGSKREGQDVRSCTHCAGNGYRTLTTRPDVGPGGAGTHAGGQNGVTLDVPAGPPDVFGRPWGHTDYGLHPATVNAS